MVLPGEENEAQLLEFVCPLRVPCMALPYLTSWNLCSDVPQRKAASDTAVSLSPERPPAALDVFDDVPGISVGKEDSV